MSTRSEAFLQLRGVGKRYEQGGGVDDVDITLERGRMLVLLGPSGSGKTTLLRSIAGLEQPDRGDVVLDGKVITGVPVHKRGIGMVFQTWALFPHMNVRDNVAFGLKMAGVNAAHAAEQVNEALELVHMEDFAQRRPSQLSGGQQQRVALARAIVTRPKLLLFDEPLSSLDQKIRLELRAQLRQIQLELGFTGVYVTHDHAEALALGDRIVVMNDGRLIEEGSPLDVFTAPRHAFTASFLAVGTSLGISDVDVETNSVVTEQGLEIHLSPLKVLLDDSAKTHELLVPTRAVSILSKPGEHGTEGQNLFAGEVTSVEFEHAGLLCTIELDGADVILRSTEPLDSDLKVGSSVVVFVNAEKLSLVAKA
ncbi:MAG: spermidine/putrescine transporter ATP-binding protein [Microbacteriaceae bacterium]|jgi:ABC-type Fe3+/spermidine/putrescine transport system ATPase subunit|nr:spermidine/putrescine transporter ATP-binding protein [Microbacteriaceae bacterium]